ncbi:uncharacterized protein LOC123527111 [Mercenaria mercenaria]|uniref:uncharacterized protein LOC123527111 n=1 Tax=Mercenaria mercenaria TaxID=6596 RepID=UPI00234F402B|nr:uncharacterized protein LOC123527111 [Mercenaria mercenaria]
MWCNVFAFSCGAILVMCISQCAGIRCFQCSDSGDDENADCLRGVRGLSGQRADFERQNTTKTSKFPHLKECSHYFDRVTGRPLYQFCKIEMIYSAGSLNAYIRDCSNGEDFSADLNLTRLSYQKNYLRPDNQSTCGYSHRHLANICVQLCDTDFCNGPTAGQNLLHGHQTLIFLITAVAVNVFFMKLI